MKDYPGQPCFFTELCKLLQDDTVLARPSVGESDNQVKVLILVSQEAPDFILCLLPLAQNIGEGFRQP